MDFYIKKGTSFAVPVRLLKLSDGSALTGVTSPTVKLHKQAAGSISSFTVFNGSNWKEIDSTSFPGVYDLVLGTGDTDTEGFLKISVTAPTADVFIYLYSVITYNLDDGYNNTTASIAAVDGAVNAAIDAKTSADTAALNATSADLAATIASQKATDAYNASLLTYNNITDAYNAANIAAQKSTDGYNQAVLAQIAATNAAQSSADGYALIQNIDVNASSVLALLDKIRKYIRNKSKIDINYNTFTVYDDDGSSIIEVYNLKDQHGAGTTSNIYEKLPTQNWVPPV